MDDALPAPDRDALAAELALGLLEGAEKAQAMRLCLSDPMFATAVEEWSIKLAPMLDALPYAQPSPKVWDAVAVRIGAASPAKVLRGLRAWRAGALVAASIAACLALVILIRPADVVPPSAVAIAQLTGQQKSSAIAVAYDQRSGQLRIGAQSLGRSDKSPELWVIPADGIPRSLGIVDRQGAELTVDAALRPFFRAGTTLAVTLEDAATAPHNAPSAAPVMSGIISII